MHPAYFKAEIILKKLIICWVFKFYFYPMTTVPFFWPLQSHWRMTTFFFLPRRLIMPSLYAANSRIASLKRSMKAALITPFVSSLALTWKKGRSIDADQSLICSETEFQIPVRSHISGILSPQNGKKFTLIIWLGWNKNIFGDNGGSVAITYVFLTVMVNDL